MLSFILGRHTFATKKVLHWTGSVQRYWTPTSKSGPVSTSCISSAWLQFTSRYTEQSQPPAFRIIEYVQGIQTHHAPFAVRNQFFHTSAVRLKKRAKPEPPPRELDLLRYDMKYLWNSPKPALYLGFAGLIPFVSPTLFMAVTETFYPELAYAQVAYGASIISFLGGARWGFALPESSPAKPDWINLANSVVPPLLAWASMLMSDTLAPAATMVIMGLGISLHYDLSLLPTYPSWFKALRAVLTIVAFFSLLGTLMMNGLFPEKYIFGD